MEHDANGRDMDLLRDIATRRQRLQSELQRRTRADFEIAILRSEVMYNIEPAGLPYAHANFKEFITELEDMYNVTFKIPRTPYSSEEEIDPEHIREFLSYVFDRDRLKFVDGRIPLRKGSTEAYDFVTIEQLALDDQTIHVLVGGESQYADIVVQEVTELLWATTGTRKTWEAIKPYVGLTSFSTTTKVNLGILLEDLLHPELQNFMRQNVIDKNKYGPQMAARSYRNNFTPTESKVMVYTVAELDLRIHIFDTTNGRQEEVKLIFRPRSRDERGCGIFEVYSELPYDAHVSLLSDLKSQFEENKLP